MGAEVRTASVDLHLGEVEKRHGQISQAHVARVGGWEVGFPLLELLFPFRAT